MIYKNASYVTKTFYGVKFAPGATCEVPGYINDPKFIRCEKLPSSKSSVTETITETVTSKERERKSSKAVAENEITKEDNTNNG